LPGLKLRLKVGEASGDLQATVCRVGQGCNGCGFLNVGGATGEAAEQQEWSCKAVITNLKGGKNRECVITSKVQNIFYWNIHTHAYSKTSLI